MEITASVATKAGLGLGALGAGATTVYFGGDYINNSWSKYERALINFLNADPENDFVFEVKKGGNADLGDADITLASNVTVSAKVKLATGAGATSIFKKGSEGASTEHLTEIKALGDSWTWECEFEFKTTETVSNKEIEGTYKNSIFATGDKGLFGILKKDLSNYKITEKENGKWTKSELKQVKIDFISGCGYARGLSDNRKINKGGSTISKVKVKEFNFVKQEGETNGKLIPEEMDRFERWFKKEYGTNEYKSS